MKMWTEKEIELLKMHYPSMIKEELEKLFDRKLVAIRWKADTLKIKRPKFIGYKSYERKKHQQEYHKIKFSDFENCTTKEHAYILGLIWADGYISKRNVVLEMVRDDLELLLPVFNTTGKWNVSTRERSNRRPQMTVNCGGTRFLEFLHKFNYGEKSIKSANIINIIPEQFKKYFLRGWVDGDGCFYYSNKGYSNQFCLSGSYAQDWSDMENILTESNICYKIKRRITPSGNSYSYIIISNRDGIKKIDKLLYDDEYDNIGLQRKFIKCKNIINKVY